MSKIPFVDRFCNGLANVYIEMFYSKSPEIITKRKIIDIQIKQILDSKEEGDKGCEGLLLDQYTLDDILDLWYDYVNKPDCIVFAAYMLHGISYKHPFIQGNKRTALMTATLILGCCGKSLEGNNEEIIKFLKEVAEGKHDLDVVIEWISIHTVEENGFKKLAMIFKKFGSELVELENNKKSKSGFA